MPPRPPLVVWVGLVVVLAAAAVLSFDGLRGLAVTVSIEPYLAWLLPIAVDAGAAVSCATWLGGRTAPDAARYGGRMTWALLAVTVAGNAGHLGMVAGAVTPPWWVAVAVGAIPPAVVGAAVHLVVLLGRGRTVNSEFVVPGLGGWVDVDEPPALDDRGLSLHWATAPPTGQTSGQTGQTSGQTAGQTGQTGPRTRSDDDILAWLRDQRDHTGTVPGRAATTAAARVGTTRADRLRAVVAAEPHTLHSVHLGENR
jgi:hypothetical protein